MNDDTMIIALHRPGSIFDPLIENALDELGHAFLRLPPDGRRRIVRHGTAPERMIQTGIEPIPVHRQKARDRATHVPPKKKTRI